MATAVSQQDSLQAKGPALIGLRMTAETFLELPEGPHRYELVDGVVIMSPSPGLRHNDVAIELTRQLANHLAEHDVGRLLHDTDIVFETTDEGKDLVYRPDIAFSAAGRLAPGRDRACGVPDLVVEIQSPASERYDAETKKDDYCRLGVSEYWLINPGKGRMTFLCLSDARYVPMPMTESAFESQTVSGFKLDLARVRGKFRSTSS